MDTFNKTLARFEPQVLSIYRFIIGLLLFQFGVAKHLKFPPGTMFEKVEPFSLFGVAGMFELVGGALIAIGFLTRPVAFLLSGEMAVAYFYAHAPRGFFPILNGGEAAVLYCFVFLYLFFAGPGPWSVDAMMKRK